MEKGNVSMYSLFLMSGGMIVPYIWGVLFLDERLTIMRTIGLLVIVAAIVISNSNREKFDKKQLAMCIGIFLCNGITSVVTKIHQIHPVSEYVTTIDYSFLGTICRAIMCLLIGLVAGKKSSGADFWNTTEQWLFEGDTVVEAYSGFSVSIYIEDVKSEGTLHTYFAGAKGSAWPNIGGKTIFAFYDGIENEKNLWRQ